MPIDQQYSLAYLGLNNTDVKRNLPVSALVKETLAAKQGFITDTGALMCDTGVFTGRAPKDKYIVDDESTEYLVWWGEINQSFSSVGFENLFLKVLTYLEDKTIYINDGYACAAEAYRLNLRVITEYPWQALFAHNLFLRLREAELATFKEDWLIVSAPGFFALPQRDGTNSANFTIINFTKKIILIGGSAYTGEIKKGVFTILNFLLPQKKVLPMHCSANIGKDGETAVFFGLSGTGKTTLSADAERQLIGDDEHGWDENEVFNFEGGCYAKCVNLTAAKEPQIFNAIRYGTVLENTCFYPNSNHVNYADISETENTRAAYPIHNMTNIADPSVGKSPKNIFFLSADAFGVLPPISKLTVDQAMYHFISGYTAKVAGTEIGITEPTTTFSACFGKPFLPLHPMTYALMLGEKLKKEPINVWLVNTGWIGGSYGVGNRISLDYTRALIAAALRSEFNHAEFVTDYTFGLAMPKQCTGVPPEILNPETSWADAYQYQLTAKRLAQAFIKNFDQYKDFSTPAIIGGGPKLRPCMISLH
ncbi:MULTISPECIES: phosphoenolpyruvate carboxykinase (ATP) [unclassified Mucilaginibacter]|uniref:phosphoenolpyruvate carboxykinase (ATP) n=1 Tax=unclassified Mucilaginibacter TaxID=2617802 RepID=UPI002AC99045|nr:MULTISPECIES: phosphoenolpyruvate carboxykinase (ATP) [unclassified Mucilaginibacter]MEB0260037.1 phosphoenolpyruvate carboxykinase (ATP) [Mucilaginibacter sp. 10I4]MEB0280542.1 phosphoenolpyruvate carboxykinase (ATP) [Mucilaginibacter sp. 10B2]MEB0301118.1 phosphoenolpyruvate carboxykinase (ATP) [Mucilaginibacter sp. 5C4]WPX22427.1 phosphoenolpyruvate carboxykinase (ATP) [Mucilaginibacter sp. 5C4]